MFTRERRRRDPGRDLGRRDQRSAPALAIDGGVDAAAARARARGPARRHDSGLLPVGDGAAIRWPRRSRRRARRPRPVLLPRDITVAPASATRRSGTTSRGAQPARGDHRRAPADRAAPWFSAYGARAATRSSGEIVPIPPTSDRYAASSIDEPTTLLPGRTARRRRGRRSSATTTSCARVLQLPGDDDAADDAY